MPQDSLKLCNPHIHKKLLNDGDKVQTHLILALSSNCRKYIFFGVADDENIYMM